MSTLHSCPLTWPEQRRNLVLFAVCTGLQYLAAPVLYVGITQASLCDRLGADTQVANLPATLFFAMTAMPALLAWLSPRVSSLKRNLMACYGACACMLAATAFSLTMPLPRAVQLAIVILQGGVSGAVMPAAIAFLWEVIGRGSDESRRGVALALAFGGGPMLAVIGSLAQTALLGGQLFGLHFPGYSYPGNFIALFLGGAPCMALAACLSQWFIVPPVDREVERRPISEVVGLLLGLPLMFLSVGLVQFGNTTSRSTLNFLGYALATTAAIAFVYHFRDILKQRVMFWATLVTILVYAGDMIPSNMNLYSPEVLGDIPEKYAGLQNTLRFGFKVFAGVGLGWLLTRTNPRTGMLATATIFLASQVWAILVTGPWYLVAFGLYGAGELFGVYSPNYMVSASRPDQLRHNMAFATMLMAPAAPAGYLFGALVDVAKERDWAPWGMTSAAFGFRLSFFVCSLSILAGIAVAALVLPRRPRPS